jgi:cell fate regulator YaaT (PSP1 superfamily)
MEDVYNEKDAKPNVVMLKINDRPGVICADAGDMNFKIGDYCICTENGEEFLAEIRSLPGSTEFHCKFQPLRRVLRKASEKDIEVYSNDTGFLRDAFRFCIERIQARSMHMKLIKVKNDNVEHKIIFYYTAEARVDFRELVKDLAARFKTRIEMRQIGVRDEAKLLTGCGICGRGFCCASFLGTFAPISIRMAKEQNINLNPTKISGICGRLMCCLSYEVENRKPGGKRRESKNNGSYPENNNFE